MQTLAVRYKSVPTFYFFKVCLSGQLILVNCSAYLTFVVIYIFFYSVVLLTYVLK